MVFTDTGSSNGNSVNGDEIGLENDINRLRTGEDSDSDFDENDQYDGYMPLPMNPEDGELILEVNDRQQMYEQIDDDVDNEIAVSNAANITSLEPGIIEESNILVQEVWSKPTPKEVDIELSDKKIDLVKQVMVNIQLPPEVIPDWAKNVPEAEWKDYLLQKLVKNEKTS